MTSEFSDRRPSLGGTQRRSSLTSKIGGWSTQLKDRCCSICPRNFRVFSSQTSDTNGAAAGIDNSGVDMTMFHRTGSIDTGLGTSQTLGTPASERIGDLTVSASVEEGADDSDENPERENWASQSDFTLAVLGYSVGLGNVWRFPYLCYVDGGGAFLIPYTILLILVAIPIFYLELAIGQFTSCGPLTCWDFAPMFKGIGVAQMILSTEVAIYYNMVLAWALYYVLSSLFNCTNLPYAFCNHYWNTPSCIDRVPLDTACNETDELIQAADGACYNDTERVGVWNTSLFNITKRPTASYEYYNNRVLRLSSGIDVMGPAYWDLALCLLGAWCITFFSIVNGIKTTGKVVYVTALFPYVALLILVIRGVTLENSVQGIIFYLKPNFSKLSDASVWCDAAVQIFFGMSTCWGGLCTLASYSRFHNNPLKDSLIVTITNYFTGILAGLVIFSFLGFLAGTLDTTVDKVADQGPGLAFIVYPYAATKTSVSPLWTILFFLMLLSMGVNTQFVTVETIVTAIMDQFQFLKPHKFKVVISLCSALYLLGLPLCTGGGAYLLELMNQFCSGWNLVFVGLTETLAVAWVYGVRRFGQDISIMTGANNRQLFWWRLCWFICTPGILGFVLIYQWVTYKTPNYVGVLYPKWAEVLGWLMALSSVVWIPVVAIVQFVREKEGTFCQRMKAIATPTKYWGPSLPKHRKLVDYVEDFDVDPWTKEYPGTHRHSLPNIVVENPFDRTSRRNTATSIEYNRSSRRNTESSVGNARTSRRNTATSIEYNKNSRRNTATGVESNKNSRRNTATSIEYNGNSRRSSNSRKNKEDEVQILEATDQNFNEVPYTWQSEGCDNRTFEADEPGVDNQI